MAETSETFPAGGSHSTPPAAVDEAVVLATTTVSQSILFGGAPARLEMEFQVLDDRDYTSRRPYHGSLYLHLDGKAHYVGYVVGYLVLKPSTTRPVLENPEAWIAEWLVRPVRAYNDNDAEMMCALRALYKRTGRPRFEGNGFDHTDTVVFIQKVYIKYAEDDETTSSGKAPLQFAGKGLLTHAFALYYRAFTSAALPEAYRVSGTVHFVLEPALPANEEETRVWELQRQPTRSLSSSSSSSLDQPPPPPPTEAEEDAFVEQVARTLEKIYQRPSIGYEVRARDVAIGGTLHTILGRRLEASTPQPGESFGTITYLPTFSPASPTGTLTSGGTPMSSSSSSSSSSPTSRSQSQQSSSASTMSQGIVHGAPSMPSSRLPSSPATSASSQQQHVVAQAPPTSETRKKRKRECGPSEDSDSDCDVRQPNWRRQEKRRRQGQGTA